MQRLTGKQEAFAREVARGATLADAYRAAYNAKNMGMNPIRTEASRLMAHPAVSLMVSQKREQINRMSLVSAANDRERVLDSLRAIVDGTVVVSATQLRALELLGKSAGVFNERLEGPRATRTSAEIETDIAEKLGGCGIQLTNESGTVAD